MKELDLDPDSEKLLDPDTQKMNVDPQPWAQFWTGKLAVEKLRYCNFGRIAIT